MGIPNPDLEISSRLNHNLKMSILNFDGPSGRGFGKPLKVILGIGALAAAIAIASTLAANININSGPVEFGQGVAQTTACDDSIMITPRSTFINTSGGESNGSQVVTVGAVNSDAFIIRVQDVGSFYVGVPIFFEGDNLITNEVTEVSSIETETISDEIGYPYFAGITEAYVITVADDIFDEPTQTTAHVGGSGFQFSGVDVSDIDATEGKCLAKTFTLKAYGETETASLAEYSVYVGETGFLSSDGAIESTNPGTSSSSFSLDFNAPRISASSVYKITIESSDRSQVLLDGRTFNFSHIALLTDSIGENATPLWAQCSNGVCTAEYITGDLSNGMGQEVSTEFVLEKNSSGTADKKWTITVTYEGQQPYVTYGFIKYFNGTYFLFQGTEDSTGEIAPEDQFQALFSTGREIPVDAPGEYSGSLTWSYPSESRYTE